MCADEGLGADIDDCPRRTGQRAERVGVVAYTGTGLTTPIILDAPRAFRDQAMNHDLERIVGVLLFRLETKTLRVGTRKPKAGGSTMVLYPILADGCHVPFRSVTCGEHWDRVGPRSQIECSEAWRPYFVQCELYGGYPMMNDVHTT